MRNGESEGSRDAASSRAQAAGRPRRTGHAVGVLLVVVSVLSFVGITGWPQYALSRECNQAMERGGSECVDALLLIVMDQDAGYRERNHSIEVLGRLRDVRALPVLQGLYTGEDREPASIDDGLSQRLLADTIRRLGGRPTVNPLVGGWGSGATPSETGTSP
jgi:hypothetical protein